jgi:tetratricopeptide (TPR) repeat protein
MAFDESLKGTSPRKALDYAQRSLETFDKAGYRNLSFSRILLYLAGLNAYLLGDFSRALEYARDAIRFGEESKDAQALSWGPQIAGFALTCLGKHEQAIASFQKSLNLATRLHCPLSAQYFAITLCFLF